MNGIGKKDETTNTKPTPGSDQNTNTFPIASEVRRRDSYDEVAVIPRGDGKTVSLPTLKSDESDAYDLQLDQDTHHGRELPNFGGELTSVSDALTSVSDSSNSLPNGDGLLAGL